jgi:hypothetical protein
MLRPVDRDGGHRPSFRETAILVQASAVSGLHNLGPFRSRSGEGQVIGLLAPWQTARDQSRATPHHRGMPSLGRGASMLCRQAIPAAQLVASAGTPPIVVALGASCLRVIAL